MSSRTLTVANQITVLRLVFVPLFAILAINGQYRGALVVLSAAAVSDALDGTVARLFHQETPLGVALDPIADKILMTTAFLTLAFQGVLPWWITIVVLSRDVGLVATALLIILISGYRTFRPTVLGKASTAVQVSTVLLAVASRSRIPMASQTILNVFVYLTAILAAASGINYLLTIRNPAPYAAGVENAPAPVLNPSGANGSQAGSTETTGTESGFSKPGKTPG